MVGGKNKTKPNKPKTSQQSREFREKPVLKKKKKNFLV
jgi:hypothetical protein